MKLKDVTITQPRLLVTLDGAAIPQDSIKNFEFTCDEDTVLPRCVVRFDDAGNERMDSFLGLEFGSDVSFSIYEANEAYKDLLMADHSMTLTPLTVAAVHSTQQKSTGYLEVLCEHPWRAFNDSSQHAYLGDPNSEIIKKICVNSSKRGFSFADFDDEIFLSSDDNGMTPRYKTADDLDFILKDLIPFTTINKAPAKFWVDERNRVHLSSFQSMYMAESKVMIVQGNTDTLYEENLESRAKTMKGVAFAKNVLVKVGDTEPENIISILKTEVAFDDPASQMTFSGTLLPKIAIGKYKQGSKTQSGYVPVSLKKMALQDGLDRKFYKNYTLDDMKSLALNDQQRFNSFFEIEVETSFVGNALTTGDNADFYMPASNGKISWLNGKWHVKGVRYRWNSTDAMLTTVLTLIRPSFIVSSSTSIMAVDTMYSVGMIV